MSNKAYWATSLTGGGTGALDTIDGTNLADGDLAIVVTSSGIYHYVLDDDSATGESSPDIISPDSNAGDKRWILVPFTYAKDFTTEYISSTQTLNSWVIYHITSGSAFTVYTPSSPRDGDRFGVIDETEAWETYNLTIDGTDTDTVMGDGTLVCDQPGMFILEYKASSGDWRFSL